MLEALGEYVIVLPDNPQTESKGGIILSSSESEVFSGEVLTAGKKTDVKTGQKVIFRPYSGLTMEVGGKKVLALEYYNIVAIEK